MLDPTSWSGRFAQYGLYLLWAITAAIGFGLGVGISLKVFDWLSTDIDEWEEIKKGNMGVSLIFVSLIVMVGLIVYKVILGYTLTTFNLKKALHLQGFFY